MGALKKEQVSEYLKKLECSIAEYMRMPASERSASGVRGMLEYWSMVDAAEQSMCGGSASEMTKADAEAWVSHMANEDGSTGQHWLIEQTSAVAESMGITWEHLTPWCWWVAMNMMYSDYCEVAMRYGVATPEFFADMAKAFLFDKDGPGPKEKLAAYYHGIVKTGE